MHHPQGYTVDVHPAFCGVGVRHRRAETRVLKTDTLACRNARFKNTSRVTSVSKWSLDLFQAMVGSVSVRFKNAGVEKVLLNIRIQWNAGTACVSECVLKTLACRGLRVGPSKQQTLQNKNFVDHRSCESWLAFLVLEPGNPPAISCSLLPYAPQKPRFSAGKCIVCRKMHFLAGMCICL